MVDQSREQEKCRGALLEIKVGYYPVLEVLENWAKELVAFRLLLEFESRSKILDRAKAKVAASLRAPEDDATFGFVHFRVKAASGTTF